MTKRNNGYWKKWENVEVELRKLMEQNNGLIPSSSTFIKNNLGGLLVTIHSDYGGLEAVRKRLGVHKKLCSSCNELLNFEDFRTKKHKKGSHKDNICIKCSNDNVKEYRATWKGRAAELFRRAKERSIRLNREFDLTKEWVWERLQSTDFKCEVSGIPLIPDTRGSGVGWRNRFGASLDRINSDLGYTKDNVRIVANRINIALGDLTDDDFEEFAIGFLRKRGWNVNK